MGCDVSHINVSFSNCWGKDRTVSVNHISKRTESRCEILLRPSVLPAPLGLPESQALQSQSVYLLYRRFVAELQPVIIIVTVAQ